MNNIKKATIYALIKNYVSFGFDPISNYEQKGLLSLMKDYDINDEDLLRIINNHPTENKLKIVK